MIFCKYLSIMNGKQLVSLHIWLIIIIMSHALKVYSRMQLEMPKSNSVNVSVCQVDFD